MPEELMPDGNETSSEYGKSREKWLNSLSPDDYIMVSNHKIARNERKARKAFSKVKLERIDDIFRVVVRQGGRTMFVVADADVYRVVGTNTYVLFGPATVDDSAAVIQQLAQMTLQSRMKSGKLPSSLDGDMEANLEKLMTSVQKGDDTNDINEIEGLKKDTNDTKENTYTEDDVETVMAQTECSHDVAVEALKKYGSTVEAIMGIIE